jgi:hypothetical protein
LLTTANATSCPSAIPCNAPIKNSEMGGFDSPDFYGHCFVLLLPLLGILYLDVYEAKYEVKAQVEKLEQLRREVEQKHSAGK